MTQETLEEAAKKYWAKQPYNEDAFIEGAKWQQERLKETLKIDLTNLCYYDKRNPDCSVDDEDIEDHKKSLLKKNKTCSCDNCFYGRAELAEQIIWQQERMYSEAIEFAEWIRIKDFQTTSKDNWIGLDMKYYTTEELFEQFKKK